MININCAGCNICCQNPHLAPVLLPSEKERLKKYSRKVETPHKTMFVLSKKKNGNCVFLDDKIKRCVIYSNRPLECVLYPFLLDFRNAINIKLDKRFCPRLKTLEFDKEKILSLIRQKKFPKDWILGYEKLQDY
jgi:Fe-S-cluster containining protein